MHLIVIGVRYKTTNLDTIEQFTFSREEIPGALQSLMQRKSIQEAAILSTCNRSEIYATVSDIELGYKSLVDFIATTKQIPHKEVKKYTFTLLYEDAIQHMFRVASGLDSIVVGEYQIMSQVKEAYNMAYKAGTSGTMLDKIFKSALKCGKRVRSEVGISDYVTSISGAAIELAKQKLENLEHTKGVIVGAGNMGQLALLHLLKNTKVKNLAVLNRSTEKLKSIKERFPTIQVDIINHYKQYFKEADFVIVATSVNSHLFHKEDLEDIGQTLIIDIGVPRNVHAHVKLIEGITLLNHEHISLLMKEHAKEKEVLVDLAHKIVYAELDDFMKWKTSREAVPIITELREKVENIRKDQVAKAYSVLSKCHHSSPCNNIIEQITTNILNKILHDPTVLIKGSATQGEIFKQAEILRKLFNLNSNKPVTLVEDKKKTISSL